ncbi:hypothetical protein N7541_000228 [Penicillium brevicompactum]|uniref:Lariat debranching enzyme C-terminal domain-containing protein n=1 Tax=Penicillium brevicompactum TaxID=5074 RepID=A0A9W9RU41_PENBR|nr:hypothetical protein N7541_000228 [Penicillium brevicompactum]
MASLRIAFEGCGHGSLNEIYDIVKLKAARLNWESVDLLIIGGDFQALRNSNDATCISMPIKYRQIGDFHEYYSGQRAAPFPTIFLGGNHEASNYLFELSYGGWVAPNIYYLGAANIVQFGSLRISGVSGIWKGYDYRKPHFERLPYNDDDLQSIYHIREMDVRKLLQVRTQVDIGLSHDWPQGVEKFGDYQTLFEKKKGFKEDSEAGHLGSVAARELLDHLRPALWFSAHLHVRYTAFVRHGPVSPGFTPRDPASQSLPSSGKGLTTGKEGQLHDQEETPATLSAAQRRLGLATGDVQSRIAAWQDFGKVAHEQEMADQASFMAAFKERQAAGKPLGGNYTFEETLKIGKGPPRKITRNFRDGKDMSTASASTEIQNVNADSGAGADALHNEDKISLGSSSPASSTGARLAPAPGTPSKAKPFKDEPDNVANEDRISLGSSPKSVASPSAREKVPLAAAQLDGVSNSTEFELPTNCLVDDDLTSVANEILPISLERSPTPPTVNKILPPPEAISNKLTKFLTLDKPRNHDPFVELIEIHPISTDVNPQQRPFRLQYDKEWLAITRVFAEELELGNVEASVPAHKGYEYYQKRIAEEEAWVQENVVNEGLMDIPDNFARTAPVYDPSVPITTEEQPVEYTNPQTERFCRLLQIRNNFDLSDEERRARMEAGPLYLEIFMVRRERFT